MTETTSTGMTAEAQAEAANSAAQLPDVRPQLQAALDLAVATARNVGPDQLGAPTPCTEYDVDALIRHLAGAADRSIEAAGDDPVHELEEYVGVEPPAVVEALAATAAIVRRHLGRRRPARPGGRAAVGHPAGPGADRHLPGRGQHAHVGSRRRPPASGRRSTRGSMEIALATMQMGLPAEGREQTPFGAPVPVADDAPAIERLVAWTGRNPAWSAA